MYITMKDDSFILKNENAKRATFKETEPVILLSKLIDFSKNKREYMFKKSKKILKENIFLNDKYKPIKSMQFSEEIKKPFLSDMQISEILSLSNKDSGFNIQLKVFEKK